MYAGSKDGACFWRAPEMTARGMGVNRLSASDHCPSDFFGKSAQSLSQDIGVTSLPGTENP